MQLLLHPCIVLASFLTHLATTPSQISSDKASLRHKQKNLRVKENSFYGIKKTGSWCLGKFEGLEPIIPVNPTPPLEGSPVILLAVL